MALIDCPECQKSVSNYAIACPNCGFPVSEGVKQAVDDVAGTSESRSSRQLAAADKIGRWADRYEADEHGLADPAFGETKRSRRVTRLVIAVVVALVVALQLLWIYSAVER